MVPLKDDRVERATAANWERVQSLGLLPEVSGLKDYQAKVEEGMKRALEFLKADGANTVTPKLVAAVHKEIFKEVHPWAGSFRLPGQQVTTAWGSEGAHPNRINDMISHLSSMVTTAFAEKGDEQKLHAVALSHSQLSGIHPFLDGNTRVAWVITAAQMYQAFGERAWSTIERGQYIDALKSADERLDLAPFKEVLRKGAGLYLAVDREPTRTSHELEQSDSPQRAELMHKNDPGMSADLKPSKKQGCVDRVFLEVAVLGGAADALTRNYQVVVPESVAHAVSSRNAPVEVRSWLERVLQDPSSGVITEGPKNAAPDNQRLLRGTRDAMQMTRENPGSVLLAGARWAFGEAFKEKLPCQDPAGFVAEASQRGDLDIQKVAERLASQNAYRLVGPAAEIQLAANEALDSRAGPDIKQTFEELRENVEERQALSEFEADLAEAHEVIHGLNRDALLAEFRGAEDQVKAMREIAAKLELAMAVEQKMEALEPFMRNLQQEAASKHQTTAQQRDGPENER